MQCLYGHDLHKSKSQHICDECVNEGKLDRKMAELRLENIRKNSPLVLYRRNLKEEFLSLSSKEIQINHFKFDVLDKIKYSNIVVFVDKDFKTTVLKDRYNVTLPREKDLTFQELRKANRDMSEDSFPASKNWKSADWAMAITGELGELCNMFKKRSHGKEISQEDIEHEFADIQIYLEKWADREGINLAEATRKKFNIVAERVGSKAKL